MDGFEAYKARFGDVPTTIGLDEGQLDQAEKLLAEAAANGRPFADDVAFYLALGLEPPPDDASI